ncbi:MAG TPA: hypothetical protein VFT19_06825 [Solirubrobacterales bacterium]|nr:hypothetical protein [Solirubrobacterales bacterium]
MKNHIDDMSTARFARQAGIALAAAAAAMSIVCALFVPYAYPWPSLAWAVLACASAVWVARVSTGARSSISDVIWGVDAESPAVADPAPLVASSKRGIS